MPPRATPKESSPELSDLRARLAEAEETLRAIRCGEVDALVTDGANGPQVFTLEGADHAYRVLIESMTEGALTLAADMVVLYANKCFAQMVKSPLEKVMGCSFRRFLSADDLAALEPLLQRPGESDSKIQVLLNAGDGTCLPVQISIRPLATAGSKGAAITMVVADMTQARHIEKLLRNESRRAEAALSESEAKLAMAFASMTEAISIADASGRLTDFNDEFVRYHRFKNRDECSRTIADGPKNLDAFFADGTPAPPEQWAMARALRGETASNVEYRMCHKGTGETWWGSYSFGPIQGKDGGFAGAVVSCRDVTERKQLEKDKAETLRLLDTLLTHAPVGFAFLDRDLRYVRINERLAGINGYSVAAHLGRSMAEILPSIAPALKEMAAHILATGQPALDHEFPGETASAPGVARYWNASWYPVRGERGEIIGFGAVVDDITERKQTEAALRHNERRFRGIFDSAFQFIGLMTPDGTLLEANQTALEAGGLRAENVIGKPFWECDWWTLTERTGRELRTAIGRAASGELVRYDVDVRGAEGQVITIDFSIKPIRDEAGRVVLLIPEGRDITFLKRVEENLRLTNQRFALAVKCSQAVLWQQDLELRYTWLHNPAPGIDGADYVGKKDADLLECAEDAAVIGALKREVIRSGVGLRREFSPQIKGVVHCFDVLLEPLWDDAGLVFGLTGAAIDITDRKRAEEAVARLAAIVECSYDALFSEDLDGIVTSWNCGAEQIFGYSADEIIGTSILRLIPDAGHAAEHELQRKIVTGMRGGTFEATRQAKDGREFHASITVSPMRDAAGKIIGTSRVIRDITERKLAADRLREAKEAAEAANAAKDRFLATLSHELRTPLTPVLLVSEVHAKSKNLAEDLREDFEMIHRNIVIEAQLIDDLLDVSRIQQGKMRFNFKLVDVHEAIARALEMLRSEAEEKGIAVRQELSATPATLEADPARLRQVLCNLLRNAVKFTPPGGTITVHTARDQSALQISVADTGAGIGAEDLERIFQPFEQVDAQQQSEHQSLGLGLAISGAIISAHRGRIWAESPGANQGATFHVRLLFEKTPSPHSL